MEKEFVGKFMVKDTNRIYKSDCRVVLNEDKIFLNYQTKNGVKSKEYKADCIFSFEDEKLIKITERKNTLLEIIHLLEENVNRPAFLQKRKIY